MEKVSEFQLPKLVFLPALLISALLSTFAETTIASLNVPVQKPKFIVEEMVIIRPEVLMNGGNDNLMLNNEVLKCANLGNYCNPTFWYNCCEGDCLTFPTVPVGGVCIPKSKDCPKSGGYCNETFGIFCCTGTCVSAPLVPVGGVCVG